MSSTEFTVGMSEGRNSSKVLKPPGGGCSDIFGNLQNPESDPQIKETKTQDRIFGSVAEQVTPSKAQINRNKSDIFGIEERSDAVKANRKRFVQHNPITGETVEIDLVKNGEEKSEEKNIDEKTEEKVAVEEPETKATKPTSVRVTHPPGGKSSGIF